MHRPKHPGSGKERLDQLLVSRGLAESRQQARRLVLAGDVLVNGEPFAKPGTGVRIDAEIRIRAAAAARRYVSRGGLKLEAALDDFGIAVRGRVALDLGASTGGFTDCLLQRGCRRVTAVDVGYGILDWGLRNDPRVFVLERVNARHLTADQLPEPPDLVTADLSFISLEKVLPGIVELADDPEIVALVKPQFEVGRGLVGKGGVVRDASLHRDVLHRISGELARSCRLFTHGVTLSPITGPKGNREFFLHLLRQGPGLPPASLAETIDRVVERRTAATPTAENNR